MPKHSQTPSLYSQVVKISQEHLGPAGERFIHRQISTHLNVEPEDLQKKDLPQLVTWVRLTFALLTNDTAEVERFTSQLQALAKPAAKSIKRRSLKHA